VLQKKGALPEHCVAVVLFEVLKVVAACHRRSVFHGDIKVRCPHAHPKFAATKHTTTTRQQTTGLRLEG
jgi:serine/threonine protein kinase